MTTAKQQNASGDPSQRDLEDLSNRDLAIYRIRRLVASDDTPAATQAQLCRTLLEATGELKSGTLDAGHDGAHSEMPLAEIDRLIARLAKEA
jgi:hypothetical protein